MNNKSRIIESNNFSWNGVDRKDYKTDSNNFKGVHRYSLLDNKIPELNTHTRYFEIEPGGYSSLEYHRHPHSVIIIRGSGSVVLDNQIHHLKIRDVIYIAPETIHQFHADNREHLGFICIVDRYRDKPVIPDKNIIDKKITSQKVLKKIKK